MKARYRPIRIDSSGKVTTNSEYVRKEIRDEELAELLVRQDTYELYDKNEASEYVQNGIKTDFLDMRDRRYNDIRDAVKANLEWLRSPVGQ